ncbi:unnamed protein product [Vitrella brassicaformis CCMP3155]|uniref:Uncharacterized protein n=1 Tax=Vitrella brassicaformis (strain CCMP3155) TaxID=1169540 RepID=A0A0G4GFG1_VITBC|nr:unnamed protein product [Vitrella brassicaformis CCMP3155]|eukprot:CEM28246.1 unnamed protein product [Vitrella brassicaformis CCMP3155]
MHEIERQVRIPHLMRGYFSDSTILKSTDLIRRQGLRIMFRDVSEMVVFPRTAFISSRSDWARAETGLMKFMLPANPSYVSLMPKKGAIQGLKGAKDPKREIF